MADAFTWIVRFIHVFSGVLWVGGAFMWGMIIAPNVLKRGPPPVRRPFLEAVLLKMSRYLLIAGALTIISGFWVMGLIVGWAEIPDVFQGAGGYPAGYGIALGVGVVIAFALFIIGNFVVAPTAKAMLAMLQAIPAPAPGTAPAPPSPEVQAKLAGMGKKLGIMSLATLILGTIALGAMAWAVNTFR